MRWSRPRATATAISPGPISAERARRLLGADADDRIDELAARGRLVIEGDRVFDPAMHAVEMGLARHVRALIDDEPRLRLGAIERPTGALAPTDAQWAVVRAVLDRRLAILTGGPGTGKTMTMRALVDLLHAERAPCACARPPARRRAGWPRSPGRRRPRSIACSSTHPARASRAMPRTRSPAPTC